MADSAFQTSIIGLTGTIGLEVLDPGLTPTTILNIANDFTLHLTWTVTGAGGIVLQPGNWQLSLYLEAMGTNPDVNLPEIVEPVTTCPGTWTRDVLVQQTGPAPVVVNPGLYRVVAVINHMVGASPTGTVAFYEGPMIQITAMPVGY